MPSARLVPLFSFAFLLTSVPSAHAQAMRAQAQFAIQRPAKVDILPLDQINRTSSPVRVQVVLRTSAGQSVAAAEATTVEVTAIQPSGQVVRQSVAFAPGEASRTTELSIPEAGVTKLRARQQNDLLLESTNYINVLPQPQPPSHLRNHARKTRLHSQFRFPDHPGASRAFPRLIRAAWFQAPNQPAAFPNTSTGPQLMLKVSGENDAQGVRADGVAFARVQIFYMADTPPPSDIKVWVSQSNGDISANPIIIAKDQLVGEAHWTSHYPIPAAKLTIAATSPNLSFAGSSDATVTFGAPILSLGFLNPPSKITLVDSVPLTAVFFDADGNPIPTDTRRDFLFTSNSPIVHLQPDHATADPGASNFSTVLTPTFIGESQIKVSSSGYVSQPQIVQVTGLAVLILCIVGGLLGGVLAFMNSQGKLWVRVLTGVIVGAVASWAYVFVGLPRLPPMILHTEISVLFVSLLAAFTGVKAVSAIAKAMNFGF